MLSLQNILGTKGQEFLDNLLNKEVVVTEKLNAATLSFQKKQNSEQDLNRKLTFYKGSGTNKKEITIADRVMTTFYSTGMKYINNLSNLIIDRIPANWTFVCKYFPNHQPSFINYSVLPKNNLVLSCIITSSGTKLEDVDDLRSWSEMFDIACHEPVYRGYLTEYQKERLTDYIKDNGNSKESFSRFIITLLNPSLTHSLYQDDGFNSPIDGFIFKFISDDGITKPVSAKLIDPYMTSIIVKNKSCKNFKDNTDILLSDFSIFMSSQDLDSIVLKGDTEADRYLELFYRLFNRYIKYKKSQLEDFDIDTNEVVKESIDTEFSVDIDKISNETTKKLLKDNPEYKPIFKALLGSLKSKKPKDYKSLVMTPNVVRLFNGIVDKINLKSSNKEEEDDLSFSSYLKTIHNKDINSLEITNAPTEVQNVNKFSQELELKDPIGALSFADFKKKDEKEKEEKEEKKELKSIEDMIKDLKKSFKDMSDEIKKLKSDTKDLKDDTEEIKENEKSSDDEEEKDSDKDESKDNESDDKESEDDEKSDENDSEDEDSNEDEDEDGGDDESNNDDSKEDKSDNDASALSGL
ncbi:MAG: hypothetical protein NC548_30970 [Lachnospiraceae bacterium]|nr:hypothetical protein [Lachnospiraceae bacterium]